MPVAACGWCGAKANMRLVEAARSRRDHARVPPKKVEFFATFKCDACHGFSVALGLASTSARPGREAEWFEQHASTARWIPKQVKGCEFPDVPEHIAKAADEVHRCFSINAFRAVGSGARAVLEATAKHNGITGKNVAEKIDNLAAAGHIRRSVQMAAHEIRHFGNDMAHGDFVEEVDADYAQSVLGLMDMVLQEVYQSTAEIERIKQRRLDKANVRAVPAQTPVGTKTDWEVIAKGLQGVVAAAVFVAYFV